MMDAIRPDLIIHCAAQPSHDLLPRASRSSSFETNALGTLNLLEAARRHLPAGSVRLSEHKQSLRRQTEPSDDEGETATRYEMVSHEGIDEGFPSISRHIRCLAMSKLAADILVQESWALLWHADSLPAREYA